MDNTHKPVRIPISIPTTRTYSYTLKLLFAGLLFVYANIWIAAWLGIPENITIALLLITVAAFLVMLFIPFCYAIEVCSEEIQICLLGNVIQKIPFSAFKLLCAVGNDRTQDLCLSTWGVEELVHHQEEVLRKGMFSRHDLPFRKRNAGWQEQFVKEYLMKPKWNLLKLHTHTPILWISFEPVTVIYLRQLFPQIPYLDLRDTFAERSAPVYPDGMPFSDKQFHHKIDAQGLYLLKGEQTLRSFSKEEIKTILRLDRFTSYSKLEPNHGKYLAISELCANELAALGREKVRPHWKCRLIDLLPQAQEIYAIEYCARSIPWNPRKDEYCILDYTEKKAQQLRQLFPDVRWIDISNQWKN